MPVVGGVLGFRAGGGDTVLLGEAPTIEVTTPTTAVEATTPVVVVDYETGEVTVEP